VPPRPAALPDFTAGISTNSLCFSLRSPVPIHVGVPQNMGVRATLVALAHRPAGNGLVGLNRVPSTYEPATVGHFELRARPSNCSPEAGRDPQIRGNSKLLQAPFPS